MYSKVIGLLAIGILLLLFARKPSREDFDHELASTLGEAIGTRAYYNEKDVLSNLTTLGCKLRTDDCLEIIKKTYTVSNQDYIILTRHIVNGQGASISCWGFLKQFVRSPKVSIPTIKNAVRSLW